MKKQEALKCEIITFDEFIDCITDGKGEEIKKQIKKIEREEKMRGNKNGRKPIKI